MKHWLQAIGALALAGLVTIACWGLPEQPKFIAHDDEYAPNNALVTGVATAVAQGGMVWRNTTCVNPSSATVYISPASGTTSMISYTTNGVTCTVTGRLP